MGEGSTEGWSGIKTNARPQDVDENKSAGKEEQLVSI